MKSHSIPFTPTTITWGLGFSVACSRTGRKHSKETPNAITDFLILITLSLVSKPCATRPYCTVSVTVVGCCSEPLLPVTVMLYVPAGVPGVPGCLGGPPPQPACHVTRIINSPAGKKTILRLLDFLPLIPTAARTIPGDSSKNAYNGLMRSGPNGGTRRAEPAAVEIVNVVVAGLPP